MKKAYFFDTSIGKVGIAQNETAITNLFFADTVKPKEYLLEKTPLIEQAANELYEYLEGRRRSFSLPLSPQGSEFEKKVWSALERIEYGTTATYGQIAAAIGSPNASRAVGRANSLNPISIFIPCHRVIGASGKLTGYAGGLEIKEFLLKLEQK